MKDTELFISEPERPYVPAWRNNSDTDTDESARIVIWYEPLDWDQSKALVRQMEGIGQADAMDQHEFLIMKQAKALTIGKKGAGKIAKGGEAVLANLKRAPMLLVEVANAIASGAMSELDQVFFEWRSNGAK